MRELIIRLDGNSAALLFDKIFGLDLCLRIEKPLKATVLNVEAVRLYLPELKKEINQTTERGERPTLFVKKTRCAKTGATEIEIVFMGKHSLDVGALTGTPTITQGLSAIPIVTVVIIVIAVIIALGFVLYRRQRKPESPQQMTKLA